MCGSGQHGAAVPWAVIRARPAVRAHAVSLSTDKAFLAGYQVFSPGWIARTQPLFLHSNLFTIFTEWQNGTRSYGL